MRGWGFARESDTQGLPRAVLRRLLRDARPYALSFLFAILLSIVGTGASLLRPYLLKAGIDRYLVLEGVLSGERGGGCVPLDAETCIQAARGAEERYLFVVPPYPADFPARARVLGFEPRGRGFLLPAEQATDAARNLAREAKWKGIWLLGFAFLGLVLVSFLTEAATGYLLTFGGQAVVRDLRDRALTHLLNQRPAFFRRAIPGKLVTRVTNDAEAISEFFTFVLSTVFRDILLIGGIVVMLVSLDLRLSLWVLLFAPLLLGASLVFRHFAVRAFRKIREALAELNAFLYESLSGIRITKLYNLESIRQQGFQERSERSYRAHMEAILVFAIFRPMINFLNLTALAVVLLVGGLGVWKGTLSVGVVVAFATYIEMLFGPISDLAEKFHILQSAVAGAEKVYAELDHEERLPVQPRPHRGQPRGHFQMENVEFWYEPGEPVLRNINLEIPAGAHVALVGHTGAGKTTVVRLLLRLDDPTRGRILLDGVDLRDWDPAVLRRAFATVPQDVVLFSTTLRENLRLWDESISDAQIWEALERVQMAERVRRLPKQLDTMLAERGINFSAGERQLLAMARALLRDPAVLFLDEALSSVDPETERRLQRATEELIRNRTAIIIAHRLTTIQAMDRIFVFREGSLVEQGNHEELLRRKGYYFHLYRAQFTELLTREEA